jgi:hypothetical protein
MPGCRYVERVTERRPPTELPASQSHGEDERSTLLWFLDYYRRVLARKAEGITDEQARSTIEPGDISLLGLIRHMADVERSWFRRRLREEDAGPIFYGPSHPDGDEDGDFRAPPDATLAEAFDAYWREIDVANRNLAATPSLDTAFGSGDRRGTLRWILVHMIEEYARHCGHADLLRERIDGAVGD